MEGIVTLLSCVVLSVAGWLALTLKKRFGVPKVDPKP